MAQDVADKDFRVNNFDLLRLVAAIQVAIAHSLHHLQLDAPAPCRALLDCFPGVPVFFVISGYLVSSSYERTASLTTYLRNRCLRIYPGLWACLMVTMVVATAVAGVDFFNTQTLPWLLCQSVGAIYTPQFLRHFGFGSYNGSLWTIPIELQFYFLLPIVYVLFTRRKRANDWLLAWLGLFILIAYGLKLMFGIQDGIETFESKALRYTFIPHFYMFLLGVVLQRFKVFRSRVVYGKGGYWLAGYLLFSYLAPDSAATSICSRIVLGICALSLAYTRPTAARALLKGNDISYGVYMYHGLILNVLVEMNRLHQPLYLLLTIGTACAMGYLSWVWVEKPFLKKKTTSIHEVLPVRAEAA